MAPANSDAEASEEAAPATSAVATMIIRMLTINLRMNCREESASQ